MSSARVRQQRMLRRIVLGLALSLCAVGTAAAITADGLIGTWEGIDARTGWRHRLTLTRIDAGHGHWQAHLERRLKHRLQR